MSATGRLIFNARGESVKVFEGDVFHAGVRNMVTMQTTVKSDHFVFLNRHTCSSELTLTRREARALMLQLADACGDAIEIREGKK